ncbi:hypothetical protein GGI21_006237, partial [Coemansia aciculifera]
MSKEGNTDLPVMRGTTRHRRLLSAVSDSAYVLDSFAEAREKQDAGGEGGGGGGVLASNSDRDGGADDVGPDGLHTSWDWGVKLVPAITPPPPRADVAPEVAEDLPVAVDIPRLVRLAAAHIDAPTTNPTALTASLCGTDALQSLSTTISRDE